MWAGLAYTLWQRLREMTLAGTDLACARAATIRARLLKIGAAVIRNTRCIHILFAPHHPLRALFAHAARALAPPKPAAECAPSTMTLSGVGGALRPKTTSDSLRDSICTLFAPTRLALSLSWQISGVW